MNIWNDLYFFHTGVWYVYSADLTCIYFMIFKLGHTLIVVCSAGVGIWSVESINMSISDYRFVPY